MRGENVIPAGTSPIVARLLALNGREGWMSAPPSGEFHLDNPWTSFDVGNCCIGPSMWNNAQSGHLADGK